MGRVIPEKLEVRDSTDAATVSQGVSESLEEETLATDTLRQVRDALQRIQAGTYGKCSVCGRPIEAARLEAVPWAEYCFEDQEKRDKAARAAQGGATFNELWQARGCLVDPPEDWFHAAKQLRSREYLRECAGRGELSKVRR